MTSRTCVRPPSVEPASGRLLPVAETDERFYLAASTIVGAGLGVFARLPLATGERLEVVGVLVPADSVADQCSRFADHHKFRVGADVLIPLGFGGMANHSTTPNLRKVIEGGRVFLQALCPIGRGEELVHCYQPSARERLGLDG